MRDDDAAPRIRELRAEQTRLHKAMDEALAELEDTGPKQPDGEAVLGYIQNLRAVLTKGTLIEQKAFLRSFIKRIELETGQVAIDYTISMPVEKDKTMVFRAVFAFA
jgi:hypothetical protein